MEGYALSSEEEGPDADRDLEIFLEAARRANWDALHGPRHLRSGRFRPEDALEEEARDAGRPARHGRVADGPPPIR